MSFQIIYGDITRQKVDVIVNPTDHWYSGGGGTDYAVHQAAGPELEEELSGNATLDTGDITVTKAYGLEAKYIFHTAGPRWRGGRHHEAVLLRSCYTNALMRAKLLGCGSIAFPLISSGTFRFPADYASSIAVETINNFLKIDPSLDVSLVLFMQGPASALLDDLGAYIVKNFSGSVLPPVSADPPAGRERRVTGDAYRRRGSGRREEEICTFEKKCDIELQVPKAFSAEEFPPAYSYKARYQDVFRYQETEKKKRSSCKSYG